MVHGAPVNYFEYILDKRAAAKAFERTDAPLVFVGHTHIAQYWVREPDGTIGHKHLQHGGELTLESGRRYIVDVGSVGQPRDLNPEASFCWYDPPGRTIEFVRYDYPMSQVQEKIHEAHLARFMPTLEIGRERASRSTTASVLPAGRTIPSGCIYTSIAAERKRARAQSRYRRNFKAGRSRARRHCDGAAR